VGEGPERGRVSTRCARMEPTGLRANLGLREWRLKGRTPPSGFAARENADWEQSADQVRSRATELAGLLASGCRDDRIAEFYAPEIAPDRGAWPVLLWGVGWKELIVKGIGVNGDTSFIECRIRYTDRRGRRVEVDRVAVAQWRDDRIVRECLLPVP